MSVVIVHAGIGNVGSVAHTVRKLGVAAQISDDPDVIRQASKLILPGVGSFGAAMANVTSNGLADALRSRVLDDEAPLLGICLGMQLLAESSDEAPVAGLGWVPGRVVRLIPQNAASDLRLPHMGWARAEIARPTPLLDGIADDARFYFTHSYGMVCEDEDDVLMTTDYGMRFASAIGRGNILGVQFHPEKSHRPGQRIIANFLAS